jgi:hypothetical protein
MELEGAQLVLRPEQHLRHRRRSGYCASTPSGLKRRTSST